MCCSSLIFQPYLREEIQTSAKYRALKLCAPITAAPIINFF